MRQLSIVATVLACALAASPALAGDDSYCQIAYGAHYPADDATDVPLNPVIFHWAMISGMGYDDQVDVRLESSAGEEVTLDFLNYECSLPCSLVAKPRYDLEPNTTYNWFVGSTFELSFTTGSTRDDEAPSIVPGEDSEGEGVVFSYEGSDDITYAVVTTTIQYGRACLLAVPQDGVFDLENDLWHRPDGESLPLVIGDHAGNTTTATIEIRSPREQVPWADEGGCRATPAGRDTGGWIAALLALCMLGWRGRRSSSAT